MTAFRGCLILAAFAALGLVVVHLRGEQTRCMARALRMESDCRALRRDLWLVQSQVSRLRSPGSLHHRLYRFDREVLPPEVDRQSAEEGRIAFQN